MYKAIEIKTGFSENKELGHRTFKTFAEFDAAISRATKPTLGYDKTDFSILFDDNEDSEYQGRYDLNEEERGNPPLAEHVRDFCEFYAGRRRPSHFSDENWDLHVNNYIDETYGYFLDNYQLGD